MAAAEKGAAGQRRRVGGLEHIVLRRVDQFPLGACETAPEQEDHARTALRDAADDGIREGLPADGAVGGRLAAAHGQDGVQQENALPGPGLQVGTARHADAQVRLDLPENVLQRRRGGHASRNRKRQAHRLPVTVIGILPQDNDLHRRQRGQLEGLENAPARREDHLPGLFLGVQETDKLRKVRFIELALQSLLPAAFYLDVHQNTAWMTSWMSWTYTNSSPLT